MENLSGKSGCASGAGGASASVDSVGVSGSAVSGSGAASGAGNAGSLENLLIENSGGVLRITLDRPRQLNAINLEMSEAIIDALRSLPSDVCCVLLDSTSERAFSGGGDIKAMARAEGDYPQRFLRLEYVMDYLVASCPVPVVSLMTGITMGGGVGLAGHASHRIVTENSQVAMPEVRIGFVPDVGGHYLLAGSPGRLGELYAMTAGVMTAAEAVYMGFADYFVGEAQREAFIEGVYRAAREVFSRAASDTQDRAAAMRERLDALLDAHASDPGAHDLETLNAWWQPLLERAEAAGDHDPTRTLQALITYIEADDADYARETAAKLRAMCPTSLAITLQQVGRTRDEQLTLTEVLADDYTIGLPLATMPNFKEGVRARVIDKDNAPKWDPATIEDLDSAAIQAHFEVPRVAFKELLKETDDPDKTDNPATR